LASTDVHQQPCHFRVNLRVTFLGLLKIALNTAGYACLQFPPWPIPILGSKIPKMGTKKRKLRNRAPVGSGIADALFTKVQQRVLAVLFGNHARSFYANELIALACSGSGAVQRELAQLEAAGLVTVKRVGNQKHYQANASAPVFEELRGLVLKTSGLVKSPPISAVAAAGGRIRQRNNEKMPHSVDGGIAGRMTRALLVERGAGNVPSMIERRRDDIAELCERYGVRELALFGSILRRDFDPTSSDVDAAVKFGPPADHSLARQYFDFKAALEHLLSRPVDLVELEAMPDTRLKRIIEHTKVPIYAAAA
jgi:predicted nucleotidyltransferase